MRKYLYIFLLVSLVAGCSTTKNTSTRRAYHEMKVIHNVYFNGRIAYNEGLDAINKANEDDFTHILNLYPISNPKTQQSAASQMDKSIEKSRKCIKLHSIHTKPKRNSRRMRDPKYKAWLQHEEFNDQMYRAWLLLGQSEFHKGEFLGSIGTFSYVSRLYQYDKDMVALCQLWQARAYAEMGWLYEAEDMLNRVKVDDLKRKHQSFYSAVSADIRLKSGQYKEAIPFVKVALKDENRHLYRPRFEYVLGQLYEKQGQKEPARAAYKRVIRMQPAHDMTFNARLRYHLLAGDTLKTMKRLRSMAKLPKNKDLLDQLYGAMGDLYLSNGDTTQALRCYTTAIEKSTRNGQDKAAVLLTAADLYYQRSEYANAAPLYKESTQILPNTDQRYATAALRSENLEQVVKEETTVALQDSLQHLSALTEEEQLKVAEQLVADLIAKETADSVKTAEQAREVERNKDGLGSVDTGKMLGGNKDKSWYFYNEQLLRSGQQEFTSRWGNRPLEDDWRRQSKTGGSTAMMADNQNTEQEDNNPSEGEETEDTEGNNEGNETLAEATPAAQPTSDPHKVEYYLQQIPRTEEDIAASNSQIADALYALVALYRDKLGDIEKSNYSYDEFRRRFPEEERTVELIYRQYLSASKDGRTDDAERYKAELVQLFPSSEQARIASDPAYMASLQRAEQMQDSLYKVTYMAYRKGDYKTVKANRQVAEKEFPLTPLMPRFLFLNAVASARTVGQAPFVADLQEMVERYPDHELSAMAKNMLALMGEGMKSQKGGAMDGLQTQREQTAEKEDEDEKNTNSFTFERNTTAYVLAIIPHNTDTLNQLLYDVALFNFTQFLIKDFDLQAVSHLTQTQSAVQISGFETMDEAEWYISLISKDPIVNGMLQQTGGELMAISQHDYQMLGSKSLDQYKLELAQSKNPKEKKAGQKKSVTPKKNSQKTAAKKTTGKSSQKSKSSAKSSQKKGKSNTKKK